MAPDLEIAITRRGRDHVLAVSGEIDLSNAEQLRTAIDREREPGVRMVVDLTALDYIDSAGLATLHRVWVGFARERGSLLLVVPPDAPCARTFEIVGLDLPIAERFDRTG